MEKIYTGMENGPEAIDSNFHEMSNSEYGPIINVQDGDANQLITPGNYNCSYTTLANCKNFPSYNWGRLEVRQSVGNATLGQTFRTDTGNTWTRNYKKDKTWTDWKENLTTDTGDTDWIPVSLINGWTGDLKVRRMGDLVLHSGYIQDAYSTSAPVNMDNDAFIYPDEVIGAPKVGGGTLPGPGYKTGQFNRSFKAWAADDKAWLTGFIYDLNDTFRMHVIKYSNQGGKSTFGLSDIQIPTI